MEQVTFTPQTSGLYLLDGQAFFINNGLESSTSSGNRAKYDIVQQALSGLTLVNTDIDQPEVNSNSNSSINKQDYVSLDQSESDEGPVVQLSISDDYHLQFRNASDQTNNETLVNGSLKNNLSTKKSDNSSTEDLLGSLLTPKDNLGRQFELVSPVKQNCTYAYKLTNSAELCPVIRTGARTNIVNVPGITSKPKVNCRVSNSVIAPVKGGISKVMPMQNGRKLVYVNKILKGVSVKPGLMLNVKSKTAQEQIKLKPQNVQLVTPNGLPLHINNLKTGCALKKKTSPVVQFVQQAEIGNTPKFTISSNTTTISSGKPMLLNTLLKTKPIEIRPKNDNNLNISEPSLLQNNGPPQRLLLLQQLQKQNKSQINSVPTAEKNNQPVSKSIGKLTQSQLKKIASVFRNSCVNDTMLTNSTAFDSEANTRVVCRVVYPEDLIKDNEKPVIKQGKKRTRSVESDNKNHTAEDEKTAKKTPPPTARTRSGRLSRPPRYMVKDFKKLTEDAESSYSDYVSEENSENTPFLHFPDPQLRKSNFSTKFHCPTCNKVYLGNKKMLKHFSEYPDHNNGKTVFNFNEDENAKQQVNQRSIWKKIFRKGARSNKLDTAALIKELFHVCSKEHIAPVANEWLATNVEPWDYLKTRQMKEGGGVKGFLSDLSSLINSIPKDLLLNAQPGDIGSIHIDDEAICRVLNISPGHYLPNESALKQDEIKSICTNNSNTISNIESTENYWDTGDIICSDDKVELVSSKVDDIGDISKVDTSELNDMLLDKSSLESVDQIVNERLNDLILTSPLDVAPLVETQILAHSILSSSSDLLHNVTGSTEDLLKTLDNLTPVLPTDSVSNDFDFTVLSSDFVSDR